MRTAGAAASFCRTPRNPLRSGNRSAHLDLQAGSGLDLFHKDLKHVGWSTARIVAVAYVLVAGVEGNQKNPHAPVQKPT